MKRLLGLAVSALSLALPAAVPAQAEGSLPQRAQAAQGDDGAPPATDWGWEEQYPADPDDSGPVAQSEVPPAPDGQVEAPTPAPTQQPPPATARAGLPPGQWAYTNQYGWVWMPYADSYTSVPPDGYGEPYMYVYAPAFGWSWLVAPWVWGIGPWPYFGVFGYSHFGWYHHGWWRTPERWHYAPAPGHRDFRRGGYGPYPAPRATPFRGGAPAVRGLDRGGSRPTPSFRGGARTNAPGPVFRGSPGGRGAWSPAHGGSTFRSEGSRPGGAWSGGSGAPSRSSHGWTRGSGGGGSFHGGSARSSGGGRGGGGGGHRSFGRR